MGRVAVGIGVVQAEALDQRGAGFERAAVAVVDAVAPARRVVVLAVAEGDGPGKGVALGERRVGAGLEGQRGARSGHLDAGAAGIGVVAVLVGEADADGVVAGAGVVVGHIPAAGNRLAVAVTPVDGVAGDGVGARIGDGPEVERVGRTEHHRSSAGHGDGGCHVIDRDGVGAGAAAAVLVGDGDGDGAGGGVGRAVFVIGEDVIDAAAQGGQFGRGEHLHGRAVAPVDVIGQGVCTAGRIGAGDAEAEGVALVHARRAAERGARGHVVDGEVLGAGDEAAVLIADGQRDGRGGIAIGIDMVDAAGQGGELGRGESLDIAVAPVEAVAGGGIGTRIDQRAEVERVGAALIDRIGAGERQRGCHVIDRDGVGAGAAAAVLVGDGDGDGAGGGVGRAVFVIGEDVIDAAAQGGQFGRGEHLHGRAVAPVDVIGQGVCTAGRIGAGDAEAEGVALVHARRAAERGARGYVVDGDGLVAGVGVGAVFVDQGDEDGVGGAAVATVGIHMVAAGVGLDFGRGEGLHRAVAPVDLVGLDGIDARIGDGAEIEGVGAAFIDAVGAGERDGRRDVGDGDVAAAGNEPGAVFIDQIDGDGARGVAVGIGVADLAVGRQIGGVDCLVGAVAPVHDVLLDRVHAGIVRHVQGQYVRRAFRYRARAAEVDRRGDVVDGDVEAVAALLAVVVHGDGDGVVVRAVGVGVADIEGRHAGADVAARVCAVAPIHGIAAAGRALVGGVVEVDRLLEEIAFIDTDVGAGIDGDDFCRRGDGDGLAAGVGPDAVLIDQRDRDGLGAGVGVGVGEDAVGRQVGGEVHLLGRAVAPVDAILGHRVGARVDRVVQVEGIDLVLHHRRVAGHADGRRHVVDHDGEAVNLDAVGLALLVIHGDGDGVAAVVVEVVADRRVGRAGGEHRIRLAVAPIDGDLMAFRVGVANRDGVVEPDALARRVVGTRLQTRAVVYVGQVDVGEHRRCGEGDAVRTGPAELVEAEVIDVALIGQIARLQVRKADFLPRNHVHTAQLERAVAGQGGDLDRLQGLAVGVVEAGFEQGVVEHDHRFFLPIHAHIGDLRRGVAEALEADVVAVAAAVGAAVAIAVTGVGVTRVGDHEAAVGHRGDRGLILVVRRVAVDPGFVVDRLAGGVVLLHPNVVAGGLRRGVGPGDDPAAVFQRGDVGVELRAANGGVDAELGAHGVAGIVEALGVDAGGGEILPLGGPHHHEAAPLEGGYARGVLLVGDVRVRLKIRTGNGVSARVEDLTEHAIAGPIGLIVGPYHHETAVCQPSDSGLALIDEGAAQRRVGARFRLRFDAVGVEATEEDVGVLGVAGAVGIVIPRHREAAICAGRDCRLVLVAAGGGVDEELAALGGAVSGITLGIHPGTAAVLIVGAPHHHETAAGEADHLRFVLVVGDGGVDPEFATHRVVVRVIALAVHTIGVGGVLVIGAPHHDVATIGQYGDRRCFLRAGGGGVDHLLQPERYRAVDLGGDVDLHRARLRGAAIPVAHANRDRAGGDRVGDGVGVGEVFDDPLDRFGRGVGVEQHGQLAAVLAVAEDRADGGALKAHRQAGHADLAGAGALIADAELILVVQPLQTELVLRAVVGDVVDLENAAIEVGRIRVEQADARVDQLRNGIDGVFGKGDARGHIHQLRIGAVGEVSRGAEQLLVDVVVVVAVIVVTPGDHEAAIGEALHDRQIDVAVVVEGVGAHGVVYAQAGGVELLHEGAAVVVPGHHKAAGAQCGDRGLVLVAHGVGVDPELATVDGAIGVVALAEHARGVAILAVGTPHHDEAAVSERGDVGLVLAARGIAVDLELAAVDRAVGVVALAENTVAVAVLVIAAPYDHEAAIGEAGDGRCALIVRFKTGAGVDLELGPDLCARGIEALGIDVLINTVLIVAVPRRHEAAAGQRRDIGLGLVVGRGGVDLELAAHRYAVGVKALTVDAPAAAVLQVGLPAHHETAAIEAGHRRGFLVVRGIGVDLEFAAHRYAVGVVALAVDAFAPAVLAGRGPHDNVAAVIELGDGGAVLRGRLIGIHAFVVEQWLGAVEVGRDGDLHDFGHTGAAGAVIDADADAAGRHGGRRGIAVGEVLDQCLNGRRGGRGVELDHQILAVAAVAEHGADLRAAEADAVAGEADLAGGRTLVAHAELVLRADVFGELGVADVAITRDHADPQMAAVEVGRVGVDQVDARVDDLRGGVDHGLVEADRGGHVEQFGCFGAGQAAGRAEELVEHAVGARRAGLLLVVARPCDDELVATEGCDVGLVLPACGGGVDQHRPVDLVAGGVELLRQHVVAAATQRVGAVPGDHEAAVVEARYACIAAVVAGGIDRRHYDLRADFDTAGIEALGIDVVVVVPHRDETAAGQAGHIRALLRAGDGGVDRNGAAGWCAAVVKTLGDDAVAAGVAAGVGPDGDEAAAVEGRQLGLILGAGNLRVEREFTSQRCAVGGKALGEHVG